MHTLWSRILDMYEDPNNNIVWGWDYSIKTVRGKDCMCIGAAIAYGLIGNPNGMYDIRNRGVMEALRRFADHVAPEQIVTTLSRPDRVDYNVERVYNWNDYSAKTKGGYEHVKRTLQALHTVTVTECDHIADFTGSCIFCYREVI